MNVEELDSPPIVGQKYLVPCVLGRISLLREFQTKPPAWWPVLRPSHQDSVYTTRVREVWVKTDENRSILVKQKYYEDDPTTPHHLHVDPRFADEMLYTQWERTYEDWHNVIDIQSEVEWRELVCRREMPIQRLFTGFGPRFIEDHRGKVSKCNRCPHRGALLNSMPVVEGIITCPNHGLKFDAVTKVCITGNDEV